LKGFYFEIKSKREKEVELQTKLTERKNKYQVIHLILSVRVGKRYYSSLGHRETGMH
jgi:hypothetical protein